MRRTYVKKEEVNAYVPVAATSPPEQRDNLATSFDLQCSSDHQLVDSARAIHLQAQGEGKYVS